MSYYLELKKIGGSDLIQYLRLCDLSGTFVQDWSGYGHHGTAQDVAWLYPGIDDGACAGEFNGINAIVDIWSAGLRDAFNGDEYTFWMWGKFYDPSYWDVLPPFFWCKLESNTGDYFSLYKNAIRQFQMTGMLEGIPIGLSQPCSNPGYFSAGLSVSKAKPSLTFIVDGLFLGPIPVAYALTGDLLPNRCFLGANHVGGVPDSFWPGGLAHFAVFCRALSLDELVYLSEVRGKMGKCTLTYVDYGLPQEGSSVRIPIADVDQTTFVFVDGALDTLAAAIDGITLGVRIKDERAWEINEAPKTQPASAEAQREKKWLVVYYDDTTGKRARMEIPTADLSLMMAGTDGLLDLTTPASPGALFKAAFETIVVGPDGNDAVIDYVKFVGRNI